MKIYSILMSDYDTKKVCSNITADLDTADAVLRAYMSEYVPVKDLPTNITGTGLVVWFNDTTPDLPVWMKVGVYDTEVDGNHEHLMDPMSHMCDDPDCEVCEALDETGLRVAEVAGHA